MFLPFMQMSAQRAAFGAAVVDAHTSATLLIARADEMAASHQGDISVIWVGIGIYGVSMLALSAWDKHVLPRYLPPEQYKKHTGMEHPSLKPPIVERTLKDPTVQPACQEESVSLITEPVSMLTADLPFGLPAVEDLMLACVRIGATDNKWTQYICATDAKSGWKYDEYEACEISPDFSNHYGMEVAVCLRQNR